VKFKDNHLEHMYKIVSGHSGIGENLRRDLMATIWRYDKLKTSNKSDLLDEIERLSNQPTKGVESG